MKRQVIGIEISEGMSKKTGRPYSMGTLHTITQLAPGRDEQNICKGFAGDKFECAVELLRKVAHLPFPVTCEVETEAVIRYGERQEVVTDIRPVSVSKAAA